MASLRNDSGGIISSFDVTYNLTDAGGNSTTGGPNGGAGAIGTPEITQGHRVYYNLGGAAGNWVSLGDRGANYLTNQSITITVSNLSWLGGTTNYLLFVDVNNQTNNDAINQIDNFAITNVVGGVITCPGITNQPQNVSIQQCPGGTATFSISATGTIQSVQWYKSNSVAGFQAISGANSVAYTTPAVTASDDGSLFRAVVSNPNCAATSAVAKLTFVADTTPPRIVTAVAETLTTFAVIFSERIATNTDPIDVAGNFTLTDTNTGNPVTINTAQYFTNSMGILLTTDPRDPTHGYSVNIADLSISDSCAGNAMGETNVPLSTYGAAAIVLDGTHIWKYNTNGTDLGTAWTAPGYNDSAFASGAGTFDGKRTAGPPVTDCRATIGGETVRTCITLSNALGTAQIPVVYFRKTFNFTGNTNNATLVFRSLVDDGIVAHLNGTEILRFGMPATGPILFNTAPSRTVGDASHETNYVTTSALHAGVNTLAVELHQSGTTSSDFTFGLDLDVFQTSLITASDAGAGPHLTVGRTGNTVTVTWAGGGILQRSSNLNSPTNWVDISGSASPFQTNTISGGTPLFFQVKQ